MKVVMNEMKTEDFDYYLPEELIAQVPLKNRSDSRLLVMNKETGELEENVFKNITSYLKKGDCLVLNDTKVIPARLIGEKEETGAVIEILLLKDLGNNKWECLVKPSRRVKKGTIVSFVIPPSISIGIFKPRSLIIRLNASILETTESINFWPPKPGFTVIKSTISISSNTC